MARQIGLFILSRGVVIQEEVTVSTHRLAVLYRAMPLMLEGGCLVVAVDKPSRGLKLRELHALAGVPVVPVLAPRTQVAMALERLSKDVWTNVAPQRMGYFETTT